VVWARPAAEARRTAIAQRDLADDADGNIEQIGDAQVLDPRF